MSNLALFDKKLPAHIRNLGVDEVTKRLMGSGSNIKRISIRGAVWRMMAGDDLLAERDERTLQVVILAASVVGRVYYDGAYVEGETMSPICWSADGEAPHERVSDPQSDKCSSCPMNIKGSGTGETKACRYLQRVAVLLEGDLGGDIFQLQLPATSIFGKGGPANMPLHEYATALGAREVPITAVVTEMRFDTNSSTPKVVFSPVRILSEAELDEVLGRGEEDVVEEITTISYSASSEDLGESFEQDDEEEVKPKAKPKAKPKKATAKKAKKKVIVEDDEDDEDDEYYDDEEEEEVKPKPKPKRTRKKKVVELDEDEDEDEDEDDDGEGDDDEEEAPKVRKTKPKKKASVASNKELLDILDEWDDED